MTHWSTKPGNIGALTELPECRLIEGDLLDVDLRPTLEDSSIVLHLAARPGVRASWDEFDVYTRVNVDAARRPLHAARETSLERGVLASSSSNYGDAETMPTFEDAGPPDGVSVRCHQSGDRTSGAGVLAKLRRPDSVPSALRDPWPEAAAGHGVHYLTAKAPLDVFADGDQTRGSAFVTDAVSATVAAGHCGTPGRAYNIGGGSRRFLNYVLETLGSPIGSSIPHHHRTRPLGDAPDTAADIRLAQRELGFEPSFGFRTGLKAQLAWQRARLASVGAHD